MATIAPALKSLLQREPDKLLDLIVKTHGKPRVDWMVVHDIEVRQEYRLTPMVAITCTGAAALQLAAQDWVVSIEVDAEVSAW